MRIFLDTNVILENFLVREDFNTAHNLFHAMQGQKHELFMSVGSFYSMIFLVDKYLRKVVGLIGDDRVKMLRQIMSNILQTVSVAEHDNESLLRGIKNEAFKDAEDANVHSRLSAYKLSDTGTGPCAKILNPFWVFNALKGQHILA